MRTGIIVAIFLFIAELVQSQTSDTKKHLMFRLNFGPVLNFAMVINSFVMIQLLLHILVRKGAEFYLTLNKSILNFILLFKILEFGDNTDKNQ